MYDLAIIGSGAAGLSAAINASSEKLKTVILEKQLRLGGQAGSSSLIENFVGFPQGITGDDLIRRTVQQAHRFGTEFLCPFYVMHINFTDVWNIESDDEQIIQARAVLLATGVDYIYLPATDLSRYIGCGVSYGSPSLSENFDNSHIVVVGGANSAGQAAAYLAKTYSCSIKLLIRSHSIHEKMSHYLIEKIRSFSNIEVLTNTHVLQARGELCLETLLLNCNNEQKEIPCNRMFVLIGAKPKTAWLKNIVNLDTNGFVYTGEDQEMKNNKNLLPTQACVHGIFAAGDIVSGSTKRVAAAVGGGAMAVNFIHKFLNQK